MDIRVIRVGGSLLTWSEVVPALESWLKHQPPAVNLLVAGGGPWVELLRQSARRFDIPEQEAHFICLRALSVTAELLGQLFDCEVSRSPAELSLQLRTRQPSQRLAYDIYEHLRIDATRTDALPKTWDVTSDSIAARVARDLEATDLVLLKSTDCPTESADHGELCKRGYVDPYFATAAKGLAVRFVNLRAMEMRVD